MGILDGRRILVTGVANDKSIAWGIARELHAHGAELAFSCMESNLRRVTKLANKLGSDMVYPCNVQKDEEVARMFEAISERWDGQMHGLIHSLAFCNIDDMGTDFTNVSREGWNLAMDVSAYSLISLTRAARPLLKKAGEGSIVALTFMGGRRVVIGYNIMGVAKAALEATTRYLSYYLGPDKIRINAVSPGPVRTISAAAVEGLEKGFKAMEDISPMRRNMTIEEVGKTTVYLMSDLSSAITGSIIDVDCGMFNMRPE